jgi:hypothetical protein
MATLSLLDVTFKPKEASFQRSVDRNLIVTSSSPAIVFHSATKEFLQSPVTGSVLATQQYYKKVEKTVYSNKLATNVRNYMRPGAEFRPLVTYGAHVVLMSKWNLLNSYCFLLLVRVAWTSLKFCLNELVTLYLLFSLLFSL